jgi:hypothetical protein
MTQIGGQVIDAQPDHGPAARALRLETARPLPEFQDSPAVTTAATYHGDYLKGFGNDRYYKLTS